MPRANDPPRTSGRRPVTALRPVLTGWPANLSRPRPPITPATKVAELLESWPELEDVLIEQAPAFRRIRNPVLRRTVARVATLERAAGVGGVPVRELVAALRRAAGLEVGPAAAADGAAARGDRPAEAESGPGAAPEWLDPARVVESIDADALLDAGEVPLARVSARARTLREGELVRIASGFRPSPLVDALEKQGLRVFVRESAPGRFDTFVAARRPGSFARPPGLPSE